MSSDAHPAPVEPEQSAPPPLQILSDSPVLAAIVAACTPFADVDLARPSAPHQSSVYRLPDDLDGLLNTLSRDFSREALITAGVTLTSPAPHGTLTPWFVPGGQLQALHRTIDAEPFELVSSMGCLRGEWLPIEAAVHDVLVGGGAERLAVAFDIGHVAALQALGLPAVLGVGLDRLSDVQRERLLGPTPTLIDDADDVDLDDDFDAYDADEDEPDRVYAKVDFAYVDDANEIDADEERDDDDGESTFAGGAETTRAAPQRRRAGPDWTLVAWDPATLSRSAPTGLPEAVEALAAAERLGFCLSAINVWRPDERDLAALRDAVKINSKPMTVAVAARMLRRPALTLAAYRALVDVEKAPPPSLAEMRRRLELQIEAQQNRGHGANNSNAFKTLLAAYRQALRDVSVEPIRAMSSDAPPPSRPLYQVAVSVAEELVALDELSRRAERVLGRRRTDETPVSPDEDAARRDALTRRFSKTVEEIDRMLARRAPPKSRTQ